MTKNEKREHGDVLYEAILTLKDLMSCANPYQLHLYNG